MKTRACWLSCWFTSKYKCAYFKTQVDSVFWFSKETFEIIFTRHLHSVSSWGGKTHPTEFSEHHASVHGKGKKRRFPYLSGGSWLFSCLCSSEKLPLSQMRASHSQPLALLGPKEPLWVLFITRAPHTLVSVSWCSSFWSVLFAVISGFVCCLFFCLLLWTKSSFICFGFLSWNKSLFFRYSVPGSSLR